MRKNYKRLFQIMVISLLGTMSNAQLYIIGEGLQPMDVSTNGTVVGNQSGKNQWMWTKGEQQATFIGSVTRGSLTGNVLISDNSETIAGVMTNPANNLNEMSTYNKTTGTWTYLGGLSSNSDALKSSSWGISADGKAIVGTAYDVTSTASAVKWTQETGVVSLPNLFPSRYTKASGISGDQSTVVGFQELLNGQRPAAFWKNGVETIINDENGVPTSGEAYRASTDGKVIVGINGIYPFVYTEDTGYKSIVHANSGDFFRGGASDVSADGKTVVGFFRSFPGSPTGGEGFVWSQEKGLMNLNTYVSSFGIDLGNYVLALPLAISADGMKIVGVARTPNFKTYGFMVDLTSYLATGNNTAKSDIKIYPNPAKDILNIANAKNIKNVDVINMLGQKVASANNSQVDISKLPKGTYIVRVTDATTTTTHKIVKE